MRPHPLSASGGGQATILDRGGADSPPPAPEGWSAGFAENHQMGLCFEAQPVSELVGTTAGLGCAGLAWAGPGWAGLDWAGLG